MNATAPQQPGIRTLGSSSYGLPAGIESKADPTEEIPSLLDEHRQVNDNLHGFIDDLEKRLIPYMNNNPVPEPTVQTAGQRPIVSEFGCQQNAQIQRTREGQARLANIVGRLCLSAVLLFSLASCVNPETGKREVFGKSTGELLSFGIGFGKRVAPIAQEEWQKTGSK